VGVVRLRFDTTVHHRFQRYRPLERLLNQCMTNAAQADLVLVAGTSATVYPVS